MRCASRARAARRSSTSSGSTGPGGSSSTGTCGRTCRRMRRTGTGCFRKSQLAMNVLINIDVPDLESAVAFYTRTFGLSVRRRFGGGLAAELAGWPAPLFLLQKAPGSMGAGDNRRNYKRHWTPVHLDIVVNDIEAALSSAVGAGARVERDVD